jgi:hypothetical protein
MTTPHQYTDTTDPNVDPPEHATQQHAVQPTYEDAPTGHHDASAGQFAPPTAAPNPAAAPESATPARAPVETDRADGLFAEHDLSDLRNRWNDVPAGFGDDQNAVAYTDTEK